MNLVMNPKVQASACVSGADLGILKGGGTWCAGLYESISER